MITRHKLIQDFQFISNDKKIFILKTGIFLEEYVYKLKGEEIPIDKEIVDANPQFFQLIDWKSELLIHLKQNKIAQPSQISKKLIPFIEDMILSSIEKQPAEDSNLKELEKEYTSKIKELERKEKLLSEATSKLDVDIQSKMEYLQQEIENDSSRIKEVEWKEKSLSDATSKLDSEIQSKMEEINRIEKSKVSSLRDLEDSLVIREDQLKSREIDAGYDGKENEIRENIKRLELELNDLEDRVRNKSRELEEGNVEIDALKTLYQGKIDQVINGISRFKNDHPDLYERYGINPSIILGYIQ